MIRYKEENLFSMKEDDNGAYVLHMDVVQALSSYYNFVLSHSDDIEDEVDDFGDLKPILELVRGMGNS